MLRRVLIAALLAALLAAPAGAATRVVLVPGVTYERDVEFTPHGPVVVHVIRAPRPSGLYALRPVLSNNTILGRERVTAMQRRFSAVATVAGVNGDLFSWMDGRPSGLLLQGGVLMSTPQPDRSSLGVQADGLLRVDRVRFAGTWRGAGQRRPMGLNRPPSRNGVTLYTPAWGPITPARDDTVEAVLSPLPAAVPAQDLDGTVVQIKPGGSTPIPPGGAVLVGRGTGAGALASEAPLGTAVTVRLNLTPPVWGTFADGLGGGPVLVRGGRAIFRSNELFALDQLVPRSARTAVGQLADGRLLLVSVDGRPGLSIGMTNFELALTMARLGAATASALDSGASTTIAFDGRLLNRPSGPSERPVADALLLFYYGVYVPAPPFPVVTPNGDGKADLQRLAYKLVRPSAVTVQLTGPDRVAQTLDAGERGVGTYRFVWPPAGTPVGSLAEGAWRFTVQAVDDLGRSSVAERTFSLQY